MESYYVALAGLEFIKQTRLSLDLVILLTLLRMVALQTFTTPAQVVLNMRLNQ